MRRLGVTMHELIFLLFVAAVLLMMPVALVGFLWFLSIKPVTLIMMGVLSVTIVGLL